MEQWRDAPLKHFAHAAAVNSYGKVSGVLRCIIFVALSY